VPGAAFRAAAPDARARAGLHKSHKNGGDILPQSEKTIVCEAQYSDNGKSDKAIAAKKELNESI